MAFLKNGTVGTSTSTYGFSSGSFTHQKQPIMPNDQKAKLLAMHRDGKANAGIYVAVVLFVYFILVIMLLCRYSRRRRSSEPISNLDSTAEQGRFGFLNFYNRKLTCREGCYPSLTKFCFGHSQNIEDAPKSHSTDDADKEIKNVVKTNDIRSKLQQNGGDANIDSERQEMQVLCNESKENQAVWSGDICGESSSQHLDDYENEESTEDD